MNAFAGVVGVNPIRILAIGVVAMICTSAANSTPIRMEPGDVLLAEFDFGSNPLDATLKVTGVTIDLCQLSSECSFVSKVIDGFLIGISGFGPVGGSFGSKQSFSGALSVFAIVEIFGGTYDVTATVCTIFENEVCVGDEFEPTLTLNPAMLPPFNTGPPPSTAVPEPSSLGLFGFGLFVIVFMRRKIITKYQLSQIP